MAVYVDSAKNPYGYMKMCHMLADTKTELFEMAEKIGVQLKWYQGFDKASCPHFDIAQSKRELAIKFGAIPVDKYKLVDIIRRIKSNALELIKLSKQHGWEN